MPLLQALLESVAQALCEKGRKALLGQWPFADVLSDVTRTAFDYLHRKLVGPDQRWLSTTGFLDKIDENLKAAMAKA